MGARARATGKAARKRDCEVPQAIPEEAQTMNVYDLRSVRAKLNKLLAQFALLKQRRSDERSAIRKEREQLDAAGSALEIVQHVAQSVQQSAHTRISNVVSRCLEAIFP